MKRGMEMLILAIDDQSGADHILDGMSEIYSWLKKEVNKAGIN